ncbi:MAG: hypothetical protein ACUZ8H_12865 [Candidatus Anammoxibacter sp.]
MDEDMDEKKNIERVIESLVIAIGREESTAEFYGFLAKTVEHPATRKFFENIVQKESSDVEQTEAFLEELENDLKKIKEEK